MIKIHFIFIFHLSSRLNILDLLTFSSALLSLPPCPLKKTAFRVELDLYSITGKPTPKEEEMYKKTASFLGSAGASLVDFDDLLSLNPKPKQRPLSNVLAAQTQAIGKDRKNASVWVKNTVFAKDFTQNYLWCIGFRWPT